jgi:hypothetical protein
MLPVAQFVARQVRGSPQSPRLRAPPPRSRSMSLRGAAVVIATLGGLLALLIVVG